ncbi:L-rhamnose mutarotase [Maribacter stanieri]|uniref:L-rhamnose mutarotase n=1 Tax=Maribacter stanieri TaxID=440514 RepID=UPI0030D6E728|tara:strand:+ start:25043 stop:25357 length:315 start_codon:yes stop_codon:yes gene_type:complete
MKRNAFTMKLIKGNEQEYKKRHDEIWPELSKLLSETGISEYAIFLEETTSTLFAFQKLSDNFDEALLPKHPIVKKWWAYMADIMETNADNSPLSKNLTEVFYMD